MMNQDIVMPELGLTMEAGTVVEWFAAIGDTIELGDDLFLLETEKSEVEIDSPYEGVLTEILVEAGQTVAIGVVIARMEVEQAIAVAAVADPTLAPKVSDPGIEAPPSAPTRVATEPVPETGLRTATKIRATPLARKIADQRGIDLTRVRGTGPSGRIKRADVELAGAGMAGARPMTEPLAGRRAIIAGRMHESTTDTASVTLTTRADATDLIRFRQHLIATSPSRPSFNDILIAACATAIAEHPDITLQIRGDELYRPSDINIGLAVQASEGLIVPVVQNADTLTIADLAIESSRLIEASLRNRLHPKDIEGGTFTVSNLGAEGIDAFTPVINLPQSAVLGVGAIRPTVEAVDNRPAVVSTIALSLTFDHRTIDGQPAAQFLKRIVDLVEYPYPLLAPTPKEQR